MSGWHVAYKNNLWDQRHTVLSPYHLLDSEDSVVLTPRVVAPFLVSELWPFNIFSKHSCTNHNSLIFQDIFLQIFRNKY